MENENLAKSCEAQHEPKRPDSAQNIFCVDAVVVVVVLVLVLVVVVVVV